MGYIGKLLVKLGLDSKEFDSGINSAQKKSTDFSGAITKMGTAIVAAFSVDAVINFGKAAVNAYNESALAAAKLNAVLKSTGGVAGQSAEEIQALAANLQKTTTFEDDATVAAASLLATFKSVTGQNFEQAIKTAQDLATIMGGDLNGSVLQLGKALEDPERGLVALRKSGVSFTQSQIEGIKELISEGKKYEAQQLILKEVNSQVGGAAKAAGDTAAGAWTKAANAAGDFMEVLGSGVESTKGFAKGLETYFSSLTTIWSSDAVGFWGKLFATFNGNSDAAQKIIQDYNARIKETADNRRLVDSIMKDEVKSIADAQFQLKSLGSDRSGYRQMLADELNNFIKREKLRKDELAATAAQSAKEKQLEEARKGFGAIPQKQREIEALQEAIKNASAVELPALNDALYARQQELELLKQVNAEIFKKFQLESQASTEKFQSVFAEGEAKAKAKVEVDNKYIVDADLDEIIKEGDEALKKLQAQQEKATLIAKMFKATIDASISGGIQALVGSIMETGELDFGSVLGALLAPFGDLAIQLGEMALATGFGISAILSSLTTLNPAAAVAAGVALIALGSVIKAGVSMLGKSKGKSNGGAASESTTSYTGGGSAYTPNAAMANMNINVTGKISGNDIVLSYDKTKDNKSR